MPAPLADREQEPELEELVAQAARRSRRRSRCVIIGLAIRGSRSAARLAQPLDLLEQRPVLGVVDEPAQQRLLGLPGEEVAEREVCVRAARRTRDGALEVAPGLRRTARCPRRPARASRAAPELCRMQRDRMPSGTSAACGVLLAREMDPGDPAADLPRRVVRRGARDASSGRRSRARAGRPGAASSARPAATRASPSMHQPAAQSGASSVAVAASSDGLGRSPLGRHGARQRRVRRRRPDARAAEPA